MSREEIHEELVNSVLSFDSRKVVQTSRKALEAKLDPTDVIENGLARGLGIIGKKFEDGELFLMDLVAAAEAVKKAMTEVLEPELVNLKAERKTLGRVVIGTVAGDIHDIGKNIVATMLFAAGFEVRDLGTDVPAQDFVNKSKEVNPIIVGLSALLSTTLPSQREAVQGFCAEGMRDRVKIMVGGAPVTEEWAREIGADGYGENAAAAVRLANNLAGVQ